MKQTIKIFDGMRRMLLSLSLIAAVVSGCSGFLDKTPYEDYTDDDLLTSVNGLDVLLNGTYDIVKGSNYYGALIYQYEAARGCDFFIRDVGGGTSMSSEAGYSLSSTSCGAATDAWKTIYSVVTNTNLILDNVDSVNGDVEELRRIKGEALALRGLAYFDLMRLFAYPPHFSYLNPGEDNNDKLTLGVPLILNSDMSLHPEKYQICRASAEECYNYILEQIAKSQALLAGKTERRGAITAAVASALKMRVLLYMEKWSDIISEGEQWLAEYGGNYSLIPYDGYKTSYWKPYNSESIWELDYDAANALSSSSFNYWVRKPTNDDPLSEDYGKVVQNAGYARVGFMYSGTNNGLPFLKAYPDDIRLCWCCDLGLPDHPEYTGCRKYVGSPFHSVHNIPIVRLPEIYLTLAEACYKMGDLNKAGQYASLVSQVRRKADIAGGDIASIYGERRREFMLEGQNYFDMFRRGTSIRNRQYIELANDRSITFGSISSQHYRVVYPIPLREMNANPAIRNQQNPGYSEWVSGGEDF